MSALKRRLIIWVLVVVIPFSLFSTGVIATMSLGYLHDTDESDGKQEYVALIRGLFIAKARTSDEPATTNPTQPGLVEPFLVTYWNGSTVNFFQDPEVHAAAVAAGQKDGCDPLYLEVLAFSESPKYQNVICSPVGACGTWQIMPGTFNWMMKSKLGLEPSQYSRFDRKISARVACAYSQTTFQIEAATRSKESHRNAFALIPPVWNAHTRQADFVYDTYHEARARTGGVPISDLKVITDFEYKSPLHKFVAEELVDKLLGIWPSYAFAYEPNSTDGDPSPNIGGNLCRPVPKEARITYGFGVRYRVNGKWYTHYGTDWIIKRNDIFQIIPVFALAEGTISTSWDKTVDGIVRLTPTGYPGVVIEYFHMDEGSIANLPRQVKCGTPLGIADGGGTISDGKHLHLQIKVNGVRVDPIKWIAENGGS